MPVLQFNDQQYPLATDTTRIGTGDGADIPLPGDPALGVQALIDRAHPDVLTIRRASAQAQVRVNGVLLGAEPTPLMHGDRVDVAGVELRFADDSKGGATQFVSASDIAALAGLKRSGVARPTAASGGRLVSLVDGKEYTVPSEGLVLGRDAACDVVVAQHEVSRRHAEIAPSEQGYQVRDMSANGVFVNGSRVQGSQRLARADVIRIGDEDFRFYADVLSPSAAAAGQPAAAPAPSPVVSTPPAHASMLGALPAPTPPAANAVEDPRPTLAVFESLNEGALKGSRFVVRAPLVHIGRGAHNDIRLADESVSESHAKLQRREDGWYVVDMGSTNGTYVGGSRIRGERRLDGAPDVRFGGMKLRFTVADAREPAIDGKATQAIAPVERPRPSVALAEETPARSGAGWMWLLAGIVVAAAAFFVFKGRA